MDGESLSTLSSSLWSNGTNTTTTYTTATAATVEKPSQIYHPPNSLLLKKEDATTIDGRKLVEQKK
jgi:hypothetical protein